MKKLFIIALAALCAAPAMADEAKNEEKKDTLIFTPVIQNRVTSIKNQNNSGTCWAYSSLAFLESEVLKKHPEMKPEDLDLCESYLVSKTYTDRADRHVRTHGDASFSQGGSFYDAIYCLKHYGLVPEGLMPYPTTLYGDSLFNFTNFFPPMEAYLKAIATSDAKKINTSWKKSFQGMLDDYFGTCPEGNFTYQGKTYTPQSYAQSLGLNPDDYISLTSYTHHPFYEPFILEIQDNWRWASSYNLPLDEFMQVMEYAVRQGYTFAWGADVSEDGFSRRTGKHKCVATVPDTKQKSSVGSDQSRWTGEKAGVKLSADDTAGEKVITQELRQEGYDNWTTTDDHGMQIYGIAKDQNGKEYFMMKNSWGDYGPYKGFWYISKPYVAYKTMNIIVNKNAVPKAILKKLGL